MSLSNSPLAYADCFEIMDRAMDDRVGVRVRMSSGDAAFHLRMRMNKAREVNRKENAKSYPPGHPLHGRSPYDLLRFTIEETNGVAWLYAQRYEMLTELIEPISGEEAPRPLTKPEPQRQLSAPSLDLPDEAIVPAIQPILRRI